ncbi:SCO2524 family protein [Catellatospora sichuanensis]|uniref:SCO2524 family protein n=1 Tax=Catellatospora sichuanensis TaxID=1969805 RepID=UPI001182EF1F|nr:SCO2524 family protein [Catellatospora sichuanensis]
MKIQPRQQLLEIWRAAARNSYVDGEWVWGGDNRWDSIKDAEQLLCVMLPATEIPRFRLDQPDQTEDDVAKAMEAFGNKLRIPQVLVKALIEYHRKYSDGDGRPIFPGGSYLAARDPAEELAEDQVSLDVVESFALSITLTLATLGFVGVYRNSLAPGSYQQHQQDELDELVSLAGKRLTEAMVGLLRSFTVFTYEAAGTHGQHLIRTINQSNLSDNRLVTDLREALRPTIAGLRDLTVGIEQLNNLESPDQLFECGWSWGIIRGAPQVDFVDSSGTQRAGYAYDAPYLYFTVQALDGIADLFSARTRLLRLLDDEQLRLAAALQLRWELTQNYWSVIASFGAGRWPLEDLPWRTTDGDESDYFSLLVTSIATRGLLEDRDSDADLGRLGRILSELANRARITRRPIAADTALALHHPGVAIGLDGPTEGPLLNWVAADFAPLLLKRTIRIARNLSDVQLRGQLLTLADEIWEHLLKRRIPHGRSRGLWDQPAGAFAPTAAGVLELSDVDTSRLSWHHTVRVVESLVFAADLARTDPLRSDELLGFAGELLAEAEHLFDKQQLVGSAETGLNMRNAMQALRTRLRHAREITVERPGTTVALVLDVLRELDSLTEARRDVTGAS